ncbi:MAG: hypothetical protein B5M53_09800 [Candidatus Cloacimonas sp. 4484_209]|nr:MAG: hypothetical protein B5M53_09800 [Candidatus Cloacimonas sp. 4484_209]
MGKRALCLGSDMDIDKILNVILYILQEKEEVSKTKLMKLLFLIDFAHLRKYNRPITWVEYHRLPKGPIPSYLLDIINTAIGHNAAPVINEDIKNFRNMVKITKRVIGQREGFFLSPLKQPDMDELSSSEIEVIDEILKRYGNKNARELIDITHRHPAWNKNTQDKVIKYSTALPKGKKKEFFKIWESELEGIRSILD